MEMLNDEQLILNDRFDRQSVHELSDRLELDHSTFRCCTLPPAQQLIIALRFYATGLFRSVTGEIFHVHKSKVCRVISFEHLYPSAEYRGEEDEIAPHFYNVGVG